MEVWRPVLHFEGLYEVSNKAQVRSIWFTNRFSSRARPIPKILKQKISHGYPVVDLYKDLKKQRKRVHRLVLEAFNGPCPDGMEACHNDGKRHNGDIENLRWDTKKNNHKDKLNHNTLGKKLTKDNVDQILKLIKAEVRIRYIAKLFDVTEQNIWAIKNKRAWNSLIERKESDEP